MNEKPRYHEKHPLIASVLVALVMTAVVTLSNVVYFVSPAQDPLTYYVYLAVGSAISAGIGLALMKTSGLAFADFGFRKPTAKAVLALWPAVPALAVALLLPVTLYGFGQDYTPGVFVMIALFAAAVGLNEEIYGRGLILRYMQKLGRRKAILLSAAVFASMHLANLLGGKDAIDAVMQVCLAFLYGVVWGEIACISETLWIPIAWHALHDFVSKSTNGTSIIPALSTDTASLIFQVTLTVALVTCALLLWRRAVGTPNRELSLGEVRH